MKYVNSFEGKLAKQSDEIVKLVSKIGGKPVLQEHFEWPKCSSCGKEMNFIAQISLTYPIEFSKKYNMAYIFICSGELDERGCLKCETWDHCSGANIVVLQRNGESFLSESKGQVLPNYLLTFNRKEEPNIDYADYDIDEDLLEMIVETTKIGGIPAWLQDDDTPVCPVCGKAMKFVAQINSELDGPLSANPEDWGIEDKKFLDFGGDGMGFIFICDDNCSNDKGAFLWQCT